MAKAGTDGGSTPELGYAPPPDVAALDWLELEQTVAACRSCKLCEARTQTVFGVGDKRADLVLVGEGPGADEDRLGEPFVGRAGKLLDAMLAAIDRGRERGGVYICNIVKCRPPGNREPRPDEVAACNGYLRRQLELLEPKLIVALGRVAAQKLLASTAPLAKLRGQTHTYADTSIPVWVTYHPAYLLRSPAEKAKSWQDLKRIRAAL
ncbi:uracil-DNA glycosylase [Halorhodospira halochloris]|uniref:Type-4 uracil-DNA glycosylase n=1 Tax=Halorhodospira halochloris TaxID=1052 RepID=A0A0X8X7W6_HALHR|nr:uracil-DNA glycosylase [Halorhodospira halochloris]